MRDRVFQNLKIVFSRAWTWLYDISLRHCRVDLNEVEEVFVVVPTFTTSVNMQSRFSLLHYMHMLEEIHRSYKYQLFSELRWVIKKFTMHDGYRRWPTQAPTDNNPATKNKTLHAFSLQSYSCFVKIKRHKMHHYSFPLEIFSLTMPGHWAVQWDTGWVITQPHRR